jgi:hypothetical protein
MRAGFLLTLVTLNGFPVILVTGSEGAGLGHISLGNIEGDGSLRLALFAIAASYGLAPTEVEGRPNVYMLSANSSP